MTSDGRAAPSVRREVLRFAVPGFIALALLAVASYVVADRVATQEAVRTATAVAETMARTSIEPFLAESDLPRSVGLSQLDALTRDRLLVDPVVSVRLWTPDGTVAYASDTTMIGQRFPLDADQERVLAEGGVSAELSELAKAENTEQQQFTELVEVYLPVEDGSGQRYLFEVYTAKSAIDEAARRIMSGFLPILFGSLVVLTAILVGLAWQMARRLRRDSIEREQLLNRALDASDTERQRIAADLHDGVVQDLAGVTYALAALSDRAPDEDLSAQLDRSAATTQSAVRSLRTLLVDIYPASLGQAGISAALSDLLAKLPEGMETHLDVDVDAPARLDDVQQAAVYRAAREALQNVARHSGASSVTVSLRPAAAGGATLEVVDDGVGFDPRSVPSGHLGVHLLQDLAASVGGRCTVTSRPGAGTTVTFGVP